MMGVCGGLGEYFNIDPIIIRIIWVISLIPMFFTSAVIYIVCGIIIPEGDEIIYQSEDGDDENYDSKDNNTRRNTSFFIGILLVIIGFYFFAVEFFPDIMNIFRLWPILLIVAGIYIIFNKKN